MVIERTKGELIFKIPGKINIDDIQDFIDYLNYRTATKKSKATQSQVSNLVDSIKKGRLERTKKRMGL